MSPPIHASFINFVSHHARGSNFLASERVGRSSILQSRLQKPNKLRNSFCLDHEIDLCHMM